MSFLVNILDAKLEMMNSIVMEMMKCCIMVLRSAYSAGPNGNDDVLNAMFQSIKDHCATKKLDENSNKT